MKKDLFEILGDSKSQRTSKLNYWLKRETAILMNGWILPIGKIALGRVCTCNRRSRLVFYCEDVKFISAFTKYELDLIYLGVPHLVVFSSFSIKYQWNDLDRAPQLAYKTQSLVVTLLEYTLHHSSHSSLQLKKSVKLPRLHSSLSEVYSVGGSWTWKGLGWQTRQDSPFVADPPHGNSAPWKIHVFVKPNFTVP